MLKKNIKLGRFTIIISVINMLLFHFPLFKFTINNIDVKSFNGILLLISLAVVAVVLNFFMFYPLLYLSRFLGKFFLVLFFILNALCIYFINTYNVLIDKSMIGNILNTSYEESSSFLSINLVLYVLILGVLPSIFIVKTKIIKQKFKTFFKNISFALIFIAALVYINSSNWLWIDKNSKIVGSLVMPWSYVINTYRFYYHKNQKNKKEILLPDATVKNQEKSIVVLVIGESARSKNFSLYGYDKQTNPLLSKISNVYNYEAQSCATYTTAGVKCILEHKKSNKLYEILPNYLSRNDIKVIWRTTNWGEPKVTIDTYQKRNDLKKDTTQEINKYDEVLLNGLKEQILASKKNKILIVLHTSTSHGPTYFKKYPPKFNKFTPVCKSVELGKCTQEELINAYDNTILYTDYILATLIGKLNNLEQYKSSMFFVSDHGESLGENRLYMHGIPKSIAPKEQLDIPFIVWLSDSSKQLKEKEKLTQHNVFHSVLDFLAIDSPIYNESMSIFKKD